MVGTGHPQGGIALHPLGADEDVLHGVIHRMAHVQLTGDVRGRHHNGERFFIRVCLRVEVAAVQPELVDAVFHLAGIVLFCKFFHRVLPVKNDEVGRKAVPRNVPRDGCNNRGTTQIAQSILRPLMPR